jgi:hypothetical protein
MYRPLAILICMIIWLPLKAQYDPRMVSLDSVTYAYFVNKDWRKLIDTVDVAISEKNDFYLLNIRAAIASNVLNKPYKEQYYLQKANQDFPNDALGLSMMYNNYLQTGSYPQALRTLRQMQQDSSLRNSYPERPFIHLINAEVGYKISSEEAFYKPLFYTLGGVGFRINKVSFYSAFSYLSQTSYLGKLKQYQLYLSGNIPLKKNWIFSPALHLLNYGIEENNIETFSGSPVLAGINVTKQHKNITYGLGYYFSTLNNERQHQIQPSVTWYPFSNNRLSVNVFGGYMPMKNQWIQNYTIQTQPFNQTTFTVSYLYANARYFTEQNGLLVNNAYDITGNRIMLNINRNLNREWSVYGIYIYETKTEALSQLPYVYHMGILGLKRVF